MAIDYQDATEEQIGGAIETIARHVVGKRLETPAILLLELHRPVSFMAGQALVVAAPFLGPVFGVDLLARYGAILNDRANLDRLIRRIDELAEERPRALRQAQDAAEGSGCVGEEGEEAAT